MSQGQKHLKRGVGVTWEPYMSKVPRTHTDHRAPRTTAARITVELAEAVYSRVLLILMSRVEQEVTTHTHEFGVL
jgi:hypothetical protein